MTHEEITAAIRLSLIIDDARETNRAVYAIRKPKPITVEPPFHVEMDVEDRPDFPGCYW